MFLILSAIIAIDIKDSLGDSIGRASIALDDIIDSIWQEHLEYRELYQCSGFYRRELSARALRKPKSLCESCLHVHAPLALQTRTLSGKIAHPLENTFTETQIGQTPLDVAREARQFKTAALLEAFLRAEPAHKVIAEDGAHVREHKITTKSDTVVF